MNSREWYEESLRDVEEARQDLHALDKRLNLTRGALFFVGVIFLIFGFMADSEAGVAATVLWWAGWLALLAFVLVAGFHEGKREELVILRGRRSVLQRLLARLDRHWESLPVWRPTATQKENSSPERSGVADDLDLFGQGSLMQLVSMAYTGPGLRALANWLTEPALAEQGAARAIAARSLLTDRASRVRFYELARRVSSSAAEPDAFSTWASGPRWLTKRNWLVCWAWSSLPLAVLLFLGGGFLFKSAAAVEENRTFDLGMALLAGCIPLVVNLLISVWTSGPVHAIFAHAINQRSDVSGYVEMFSFAEHLPDQPPLVSDIRNRLAASAGGAALGMKQLDRIALLVTLRRRGISYVVFLLLQIFTLWDVHLLRWLERWQEAHGDAVADWFIALGELEALQSIAALHDDYPDWTVAQWEPSGNGSQLSASGLAHPLLPDGVRVPNDVTIGPTGTLLLVTGSNMSGKSTMLRSVGLNVVLAGLGAPVCAAAFRLPSVELATSIRVRDNLREGVSFYMAELHRLRDVVNHARSLQGKSDRKVLYLLDEILQGTNSRERAIAVVQVLRHLVGSGAIGAISTHDLELAEDEELMPLAKVVHFRETIRVDDQGREVMEFDYHMRDGVTPTTNALRLLELVGLGKDAADLARKTS